MKKDVVVGLIAKDGFVQSSLRARLSRRAASGPRHPVASFFDALERRLLAACRITYELVTVNRWGE